MRRFWGLLLLPYLVFLALMTKKHLQVNRPGSIKIGGAIPEGITFHEGVICVKTATGLTFFSDRCTHLGCRINQADGDRLVCPCHGSVFAFDGSVEKGPAKDGLKRLAYQFDRDNDEIIVEL